MRSNIMKKRNRWLAGVLAAVTLLGGCGGAGQETLKQTDAEAENQATETAVEDTASATEQAAETEQTGPVTFTDDLGREVTVDHPQRVAALIGSFTDVWQLAGGDVVAAANDSWESLNLDLGADVVNLGSILEPDVEQLIAANPDFVLASSNTDGDLALEDVLNQAGIPVAYFDVSNFDDYLKMLDICTTITGRKDLYEKNGLDVQAQIEEIKKRVDGSAPTVLFLRAASSNVKAKGSEGNVCGEMLADLGCVNIADSDAGLLDDLSMEAIIAADPQYIFVTVQGNDVDAAMQNVQDMLISNPAWNSLSVVQNGHYYVLDKRLFNLKPNAKWGEAYKQLADILYPEE